MECNLKRVKPFLSAMVPKIIIPAEGYSIADDLENAELIQVDSNDNTSYIQRYLPEGLDASKLIPVEFGGRLVQPTISINELGKQLLKAAADGNVEEIKILMNKGAPFTADWLGTSPLHFAAQNNHLEVCEILLRAGISKDARTKVDRTPLHMAAYEGHTEIVRCLLENKADIDCKDLLAMTPLHWAVQNCHADIVELLLRQGALKDVVNKFDLMPSDIAIQCDRKDIVNLINTVVPDADAAVQHLSIEMSEMENSNDSVMYPPVEILHTQPNSPSIPLETVLEDIDSENSIDPERLHINQEEQIINGFTAKAESTTEEQAQPTENDNGKFSESIKLLRQHGITMLPADDTNILSSILETGHSVVLTEVGKQVLNSTKPVVETAPTSIITSRAPTLQKIKTLPVSLKQKKIITMSSEEFLAMALNQGNILKQINGKFVSPKPAVKRVVMRRNKVVPITTSNVIKLPTQDYRQLDVEQLMKQLNETKKSLEECRQKLYKKEAEAEQYKQQLLLITQSKNIC